MSTNVAYAGFSIKLNEELQTEDSLKTIAKSLGYEWKDNWDWDNILYNEENYLNRWKPQMDVKGKYGFIYISHYEYDAYDINYKQPMSAMTNALNEFISQTMIIPKEEINSFAIIYYNGTDSPFKF